MTQSQTIKQADLFQAEDLSYPKIYSALLDSSGNPILYCLHSLILYLHYLVKSETAEFPNPKLIHRTQRQYWQSTVCGQKIVDDQEDTGASLVSIFL